MRILGLDPGLATVGFGIIDCAGSSLNYVACGAITTPAGQSLSSRLIGIESDLSELIKTYNPDQVSIEELFFNTNVTTGIAVAHARGVILVTLARNSVPVYEYTPLQVKQSVVGYGRAEKRQVIDMVKRLLHLKSAPKPDDAADGLALCICHARAQTSILTKAMGGITPCSTI